MKTVLITGCSSGIGLAVARHLCKDGYHVLATARKPEDVITLKESGFIAHQLDLDDPDSINKAFAWALEQSPNGLYALFNNGAYGQGGALEDISREVLKQQFESNVFGWHQLTNLCLQHMREQGEGRIIQNSSVLGIVSMPFRGAYNASKYAIEGLSDTLRLELKGSNVFVSLVEPGPIMSRFRANALKQFEQHVDAEQSTFKQTYQQMRLRLQKEGPAAPFTLPPEAVYVKVKHALEAKRPKPRYYVTLPTHIFGVLKRILPTRMLDWILSQSKD